MSKKLLSEAQIRRFQSLASIAPLQEMYNEEEHNEMMRNEKMHNEMDHNEMMHSKMEGDYMEGEYNEGEYKEEMHEQEEDPMADEEGMDDAGDSDVELDEELVERFMDAAKAVQEMADALGGAAGGDMDMGDEEPMDDMGGDEPAAEPEGEEGGEGEEELLELALEGIQYQASQKEVVDEVAKRVARRIMEAKKAHAKMNKALGK